MANVIALRAKYRRRNTTASSGQYRTRTGPACCNGNCPARAGRFRSVVRRGEAGQSERRRVGTTTDTQATAIPVAGIHRYDVLLGRTMCGWPGNEDTRWRIGSLDEVICERCQ